MSKELHIVTCTSCPGYSWEFRDKDPRKCGDALREHYAVAHPEKAYIRGWDVKIS